MEIEVLAFGQIAEITSHSKWKETGITSTDELRNSLEQKFPAIKNISYKIAVDKKIIQENTTLDTNCTVALLPAFSGG